MGALDQALIDEIISHQIDLYRLDAGVRQQVLDILTRMQRELVSKLANEDLTDFGKQRTAALLRECSDIIDHYYTMSQGELDLTLHGVGSATATHTADALTAAVSVESHLPTETFFKTLASNALIQGAPSAEWWSRQSLDASFKFANAVRQGLAQAETNQQIIARVIGKRGFPGIMDISRRNAAALVQTSVQAVANDARLETFKRNADVITALEWHTALDGHVCELCIPRAGLQWTVDGEPIGHSMPFQNPPIHFNDRCVLLPRTSLSNVGRTTRAASGGPVSATTSFEQWLSRRTVAQQDAQLGNGRAQLWRDGTITLQQLLDLRGNPLTLAELKATYQ